MELRKFELTGLGAALAVVLSGCGATENPSDKGKSASAETQVTISRDDALIKAGRWEIKSSLLSAQNPNLSPDTVEAMKEEQVILGCYISKDGTAGKVNFFASQNMAGCTSETQMMTGGRIEATSICKGPTGTSTVAVSGTYTEDSLSYKTTIAGNAEAGPTQMVMATDAQYQGACKGDELKIEI